MSFLLDTDTCVFWLRGWTTLRDHIARVIKEHSAAALAISVVTLAELRYGADYSDRPAENHRAINGFVSGITILTLVTNNKAHFSRIAGLRLENWLES